MITTRALLTLSAAGAGAIGFALLFAPDETGALLHAGARGPLMQLLGASLLGFAAMNWTARGAALGGIYGRAVVMANQVHATIGALVLLRHGVDAGGAPAYWLVTGLYAVVAGLFTYLAFFSSGLPGE